MDLAEIQDKVFTLLQFSGVEDVTFEKDEIDLFTSDALVFHNKSSPRKYVGDIDGDGGYDYTLPTGWVDKSSFIDSIEYPQGEIKPNIIDSSTWMLYTGADEVQVLRFFSYVPSATEVIRITFSSPWIISEIDDMLDAETTVFCYLVANLCCLALAAKYSNIESSNLVGDIVDYGGLAIKYRNLAKDYMKKYELVFGSSGSKGESGFIDWDYVNGFTHDMSGRY